MSVDSVRLPHDVLVRILLLCEVGDLFACKQVCRRLFELVDSDVYLQYKIELTINGMVDVSGPALSPGVPVVERLEKLRAHGERVRSGQYKDSGSTYSWPLWPVVPSMPKDDWKAFPAFGSSTSYVVVKPQQQEISVCAPPLQDGDAGMRHWNISLTKFPALGAIVGVFLDLAQDLLIVAQSTPDNREVYAYVRSFTKPGQPHPAAAGPILATRPLVRNDPGDQKLSMTCVQTHCQVVAWLLSVDGKNPCDAEVWDWKSGHRLWRCHFDHRVTFTFLDRSFLAVTPQVWNSSLHVYRYDPAPEAEPVSSRARRHVLELGLPAKDARIQESSIPFPPPCTAIFWPDPKQRIYVIALGEHSSLLIPYSTFRCLLETLQVTPTPSSEPTRLAWESWGPESTLRLDLERRHHWKTNCCYSYGSRVAVFSFDKDSRSPDCTVVIFDLNPWAVRHAQHCPPKTPTNPKVAFGTDRATLPHLALHGPRIYRSVHAVSRVAKIFGL
ncbi:hypothetical protein K466DRAFT_660763 [Polyporus arcularius HHB13444]|uniref:F-box domain-containing protein n=1 Tax=Polyporus arcularius HHB13444 TaxID=1314778 RepID=A0A5C3PMD2_9APHY|nr:hypothetical protein K466DRAFT_660763 [Polyporus arcularius HHB13444]